MVKKILQIFVIVLLMALLAFTSAALAFKAFFTQERLKKMFVDGIVGYTNREVDVEKFSLGLFTGLKLGNVSVYERAGSKADILFYCESLEIMPDYSNLFDKGIGVNLIKIEGPRAYVNTQEVIKGYKDKIAVKKVKKLATQMLNSCY